LIDQKADKRPERTKGFGPVSKAFSACCHPQNNSGLMAEKTTEFHIFTKKMRFKSENEVFTSKEESCHLETNLFDTN
jgi:hypothetical protein